MDNLRWLRRNAVISSCTIQSHRLILSKSIALQKLDEFKATVKRRPCPIRVHIHGQIWEGLVGLDYARSLVQRNVVEQFLVEHEGLFMQILVNNHISTTLR